MNEKNIHYKLCNSQAITKQIIFWTSMEKVYKHCQKIKVIYFLINSQKFNYYKCFETNKKGVFMSWIGGLKDITGSWSASMRVAGSFAIIAASVLAIENVIARFQRRKSSIEKNVQCDENVSWIRSFTRCHEIDFLFIIQLTFFVVNDVFVYEIFF